MHRNCAGFAGRFLDGLADFVLPWSSTSNVIFHMIARRASVLNMIEQLQHRHIGEVASRLQTWKDIIAVRQLAHETDDFIGAPGKWNFMILGGLCSDGGHSPNTLFNVEFAESCCDGFAGPAAREDRKFQRQSRTGSVGPKPAHKRSHIAVMQSGLRTP